MNDLETKLPTHLIGKRCSNFRLLEGGTLILYLEGVGPIEETIAKDRLWLNCAWRLRSGGQIVIGSLDQPESILRELNNRLVSRILTDAVIDRTTKDPCLFFSDALTIDGFCYFTEDELWEYRGADGLRLGIGAKLVPFERHEAADS